MKLAYQPEAESNTIAAGEFKAKCLRLMDQALADQRPLTVTKRGKVIGQFVPQPTGPKPLRTSIGLFPQVRITGDIISPLPQEWTLPEWAWEKTGKIEKPARKVKKKK